MKILEARVRVADRLSIIRVMNRIRVRYVFRFRVAFAVRVTIRMMTQSIQTPISIFVGSRC